MLVEAYYRFLMVDKQSSKCDKIREVGAATRRHCSLLALLYFRLTLAASTPGRVCVENKPGGSSVRTAGSLRICLLPTWLAKDSKNNDWWLGGSRKGFSAPIIGWHCRCHRHPFRKSVSCAASFGGPRQLALITLSKLAHNLFWTNHFRLKSKLQSWRLLSFWQQLRHAGTLRVQYQTKQLNKGPSYQPAKKHTNHIYQSYIPYQS